MKNNNNIILIVLLITIFGLITYIIISDPVPIVAPFDESFLREEIRIQDSTATFWKEEADAWHNMANILGDKSDSLQNIKPIIKNYYHEMYNFNNSATALQLDSVIRANW